MFDFYVGATPGSTADDAKLMANAPDVVAFNGYAAQYKDNPILVRRGERIRAFVLAARVAGRKQDAERALVVGKLLLEWFADAEDGHFHSNATPKKSGGVKAGGRDALDNARAVRFMAELTHLTGDPAWAQAGRRAVDAFEKDFDDMKLEAADWALAVRALSVSDLPERPQWAPVAVNAGEPQVRQRAKRYRTGGR